MTELHPHWQSSDSDAPAPRAGHVLVQEQETTLPAPLFFTRVSRRPAAIVGIMLAIAVGAFLLHGPSRLTGQVSGSTQKVKITAQGTQPATLSVQPGQTVEWENADTIPHILSAQRFPIDAGFLESPPLFPKDTYSVVITATAQPGDFEYISRTSPSVSGTITVTAPVQQQTSSAASSAQEPESSSSLPSDPVSSQSTVGLEIPGATQSSSTAPTVVQTQQTITTQGGTVGIPQNPYAIANQNAGDLSRFTGDGSTAPPSSQPESGPALWIVLAASGIGLWYVSRRAFQRA